MAGSINNNGSAWGVTTTPPSGSFRIYGWFKPSTTTLANNSYQTFLEVGWAGGFNRIAFDPFENNIYWAGNGYGVITPQANVENVWVRFCVERVGDNWAIYWALPADTSWQLVTTWTTSAATAHFSIWYSYADSNYLAIDVKARMVRVTTSGTLADTFADTALLSPSLTTWAQWIGAATPSTTDWYDDSSGNNNDLTPTGTPTASSDDPISSGGVSVTIATERVGVVAANFAAVLGVSAHTERARVRPADYSAILGIAAHTERARVSSGGFADALATTATTERARVSSGGLVSGLATAATTESARVRPADYAASLAALIFGHTEIARVRDGAATTALAAAAHTEAARARDGGLVSAAAHQMPAEFARVQPGGYASSGAAIIFGHTEIARVRDGAATTALAAAAHTERARVRDGVATSTLGIAGHTEAARARDGGLVSAAAAAAHTEIARVRDGAATTALGIAGHTEAARVQPGGYASSGAAIIFGHTETARVRDGGLVSAAAALPQTEIARVRPADYAASLAALAAAAHTEIARVRDGAATTALAAAAHTEAARARDGGLVSVATMAAHTEAARVRPADYSSSGAVIIFGHTEIARVRDGAATTALAAAAHTEAARARDGGLVSAAAAGAHTERGRVRDGAATTALAVLLARDGAAVAALAFGSALAAVAHTESARVRPRDYSTGSVILVSAATEFARSVFGSFGSQLTAAVGSTPARVRDSGLVSALAGLSMATERARVVAGSYGSVVGVQAVAAHTEIARVRDGGLVVSFVVVPFVEPIPGGGGFGVMPSGSGPFGTAMPDGTLVRRIRAIATNAVFVPHAEGLSNSNPRNPASPLHPRNWAVVAMDPAGAVVRLPQQVFYVAVSGGRVPGLPSVTEPGFVLVMDGVLAQGAQYRLSVAPASVDVAPESGAVREFAAVRVRCDAIPRDERDSDGGIRDIANPYLARDALQFPPVLGTYQITETGDLASDSGEASLRKRIVRRVEAIVGDFFHLPGYGTGVRARVKRLLRPDELERIQSRVRAQIAKEPEVTSVSVQVRPVNGDPSVISVSVTVTTVSQPEPVTVVVPVAT